MVLFDRTAGQQIDLATENVFKLLVKFKEIPPKMHFGLKRDEQVNIASAVRLASRKGAEHFQPGDA
ncbi:MAG: hypothetical protein M3Y07_16900 [Acidobacteriota bacterium]|nr:hypothetical protein [Acidobacteriota bacterium]